MKPSRQDDIVLIAYDRAADSNGYVITYDLIRSIGQVCDELNISSGQRPLESKRERATTRLRKEGLIEKFYTPTGARWRVTDYGAERVAYLVGNV